MPKSYLSSQPPPDVPVDTWLTWSLPTLEESIADTSNKIAGVMGINKAGDITHLIMPTIVKKALREASVILGNSSDTSNEPSFVFIDTSDFGFITVVEKYSDIPSEIRPEEPLPTKFFRSTSWESATADLGITRFPMLAPILFGMGAVETSVHDTDFEDKVGALSPKHAVWAKLIKEHFIQNENNEKCVENIFDRVYNQGSHDKLNAKYVTDRSLDHEKSSTIPSSKFSTYRVENGRTINHPSALSSKAIQALSAFRGIPPTLRLPPSSRPLVLNLPRLHLLQHLPQQLLIPWSL